MTLNTGVRGGPKPIVAGVRRPLSVQLSRYRLWLLSRARTAAYACRPVRRLFEPQQRTPEQAQAHWDHLLDQGGFASYIGATILVDGVNASTALLLKYHAARRPSVLDVGCSGGTLVSALHSFSRYVGTDVSKVAIDAAWRMARDTFADRASDIHYEARDLRLFNPGPRLDAIVFNEVLYYLNVDEAAAQVQRYAKSLAEDGVIIISMKDDGKSRAIFQALRLDFDWIDGILWQQKPQGFDYAIRVSRECPGILVGALRNRMSGAPPPGTRGRT